MPSSTPARASKRAKTSHKSSSPSKSAAKPSSGPAARRPARRVARANTDDQDDEQDEDGDEDGDDVEQDEVTAELLRQAATGDQASSTQFVTASSGDAYMLHAASTSKTSDNMLSDAIDDEFTYETYAEALRVFDESPHLEARRRAIKAKARSYEAKHSQWIWDMRQGFSVLLHGFGSKRGVLETFADRARSKGHVVVVNGYDPAGTVADIAEAFEGILDGAYASAASDANPRKRAGASPSRGKGKASDLRPVPAPIAAAPASASAIELRIRRIVQTLRRRPSQHPPVFLVVHNIDGPSLRLPKNLNLLATLAAQQSVHLICSVDHVRAAMLFTAALAMTRPAYLTNVSDDDSHDDVRTFNFVYHACPTYEPYTEEALYAGTLSRLLPPSVFPSLSSSLDPSTSSLSQSTLHVLMSVTDRAKKIFALLAQLQNERYDDGDKRINLMPGQGQPAPKVAIKLEHFKNVATDRLLASHRDQVDGLLAEFRDHEVVRSSQIAPVRSQAEEEEDGQDEEEQMDDGGGEEWVWIPLPKEPLENVLDEAGP